jgi:hypothetical protein
MPTPTIPDGELFMNATLYTGTGSNLTIANGVAGQSFQPDFVWIKQRSGTQSHCLYDSVRGVTKQLNSNNTGAEGTYAGVSSFNTNGFSIGTADNNTNGATYVGWNWKAGGTAVTNNVGSLSVQVSANTTSGFSIVTYTGNSTGATAGHGLGVTPAMIIIKNRASTSNWRVWHQSLSSQTQSYLSLNLRNAASTDATIWNNTAPTSTVFSIGNDSSVNTSPNTYVAYCWSEIAGFSKFGSYTGNGSTDGPFVYLGFRPKFIMMKKSSSDENWAILDSSRSPNNVTTANLYADLSDAEDSVARADLLSNGIKFRTTGGQWNLNGATYIYMAFAENPFKYSNAR